MSLIVHIRKRLHNFELISDFETDGQLALLGASGSGKSMTLKCIAGIEKPDSGYIELNGRVLYDSEKNINIPPQKRQIGYLFQNYALFRYMTVYDNVAFGLKVQKADKKKIDARVRELIKLVGLEGLEKRYPSQLSGGQRQRVAFARALAPNPQVLLLDEPSMGLAPLVIYEIFEAVKKLRESGTTILFVEQNSKVALATADRGYVIQTGEIVIQDTCANLETNPEVKKAYLGG